MIEWDAYENRLLVDGPTRRDRVINRTKKKLLSEKHLSPGCREALVGGVPQYLFLKRTDGATKVAFNTLPGDNLILGSVVYWEGSHWLVTESLFDDNMTSHGAMLQCNRKVQWQNPKTREIVSRWCVITKPYYSNLDEGLKTTISSREFKVQLPYDPESAQLDVGKRFMLEVIDNQPVTYRITSTDLNSKRFDIDGESQGFIILNIEQDQFNRDTDNVEFMICNYLEPFHDMNETAGGWCIIETEAKGIVPGGLPVTVTAKFFNTDGHIIEDAESVWHVDASEEVEAALTMQMRENGILRMSLAEDAMLIGQQITISAHNPENTIYNSITMKVVNVL